MKAEVSIKNKEGKTEMYRFYYPYQQVTKEMLTGESEIEETEEDEDDDGF